MKTTDNNGFTLLEVLIALAVFAVSAVAVISQASQSVKQTHYLEQKSLALWLAEDKLTELRVAGDWPSLGQRTSEITRYNRDWWISTEILNTSEPLLRRAEVKVGLAGKDDSLITLQGFVGQY